MTLGMGLEAGRAARGAPARVQGTADGARSGGREGGFKVVKTGRSRTDPTALTAEKEDRQTQNWERPGPEAFGARGGTGREPTRRELEGPVGLGEFGKAEQDPERQAGWGPVWARVWALDVVVGGWDGPEPASSVATRAPDRVRRTLYLLRLLSIPFSQARAPSTLLGEELARKSSFDGQWSPGWWGRPRWAERERAHG